MTKEELEGENAALRELLAAVRALAELPGPADCYEPAFTMECWKRLDEISVFADPRQTDSGFVFSAGSLREKAARQVRYKVRDTAVREPDPRCCETCGATKDLERTVWRSMADGSEHARYFCNNRRACNDRRFPDLAALLDKEPRVGSSASVTAGETATADAVQPEADCECAHRNPEHAYYGNAARECRHPGCGCLRYRPAAAPSLPETPAVVAGQVVRELPAVAG